MNQKLLPALILTALTFALANHQAVAVPYASCITNDFAGGNVYYYLNEDAGNVKFVVGTTTNDLGAQSRGLHSFPVASPTSYHILVSKSAAVAWVRTADDVLGGTNANKYLRFFSPGGIAPNRNPKNLSYFGRIYVVENAGGATSTTGTARTDQDGVYVLNADYSDALGQNDAALNGGLSWVAGTAAASDGVRSPWKIEVGDDDYLYISDFSTNNGGIFRVDPNVTVGEVVLANPGRSANPTVHTDCNGSAIAKGSLAGGNLTIWAIDGAWPSGGFNHLLRWDIGGAALPYNSAPTVLGFAGVPSVPDVQSDLDIAPDGKFFVAQVRAIGAGPYTTDAVSVRVLATDGATVLWDSLAQSTNALNNANAVDIFTNAFAIKVSPDGKKVAVIRTDVQTWIMTLTNGIPDISTRTLINTFAAVSTSTAANRRREVAFDAAGNLYAGNNSQERVVVWSPGGTTTAITSFDNTSGEGAFQVVIPPNIVSITSSVPTTVEGSGSPGRFTVLRAGDTTAALVVNYSISGTATNGTDYATLSGSVTFLPGASATNINVTTINDSIPELTETVILTLTGDPAYAIGSPATATVAIADDEPATLTVASAQPVLLERFASNRAPVTITRLGLTNAALTVNLAYSGTATLGADYTGPATAAVAAGAATVTFNLAPLDDLLSEGPETVTVALALNGVSYAIGTPGSVALSVVDDDVLPGLVLFADRFNYADTATNWIINAYTADAYADFAFDYSSIGIPEAPSSSAGIAPQRGLKLRANEVAGAITGLSLSPANGNFTGDYRLRFDLWMNYAGPLNNVNVPGQTQTVDAGVGTAGDVSVWGAFGDCVWFTANGDGGVGAVGGDYNAYTYPNILLPDASGVYAAGTNAGVRDNLNSFYTAWNSVGAPPAQIASRPTQTGVTPAGSIGLAWHTVDITKRGTNVSWDIDGRRVATVDITGLTLSANVFIGYHDPFASLTTNSIVQFGLFDNVRVETLSRPLITGIQIINSGMQVQLDFTAEVEDPAGLFELRTAGQANGPYNPVSATITPLGGNKFRAVRAVGGSTQFYLINRL